MLQFIQFVYLMSEMTSDMKMIEQMWLWLLNLAASRVNLP